MQKLKRKKTKLWGVPIFLLIILCFTQATGFAQEETPDATEPSRESAATPEAPSEANEGEGAEQKTESDVVLEENDEEPVAEPLVVPDIVPHAELVSNPLLEGDWSDPLNLSATGSADSPTMVLDKNDILHIFWVDDFDGLRYMRKSDGWTEPVTVSAPFSLHTPNLLVDDANEAHAFWLNGNGEFLYSHASAESLHDPSAWSGPVALSTDVVAFSAELDSENQLHVAFHVSRDDEGRNAGLYYRSRSAEASRWGDTFAIYQSPYLRLADQENSHVAMSIAREQLIVAWNNPGRDWVMLSYSANGEDWSDAKVIDRRTIDDDPRTIAPADPILFADGDQIVVSWHAGHGDLVCGRYFSQSNDGGETFSPAKLSFGDLYECPRHAAFVSVDDNRFVLLTRTDELTYISAWQDGEWQGRTIQPVLVQFREEATGRDVQMDGFQLAPRAERMMLVGCDRNIGRDIWFTEYSLNDLLASITTDRARESLLADDIDVTPETADEPIPTVSPDIPDAESNRLFGSENGLISLAMLFAGLLVVAFGVFTLLRKK